ncbi:MAG: group II intron reverse transcriptase/maturase [Candidatus Binatia bacterium]
MMNGGGKSDRGVVPAKLLNNAPRGVAEAVEGRPRAKGNSDEQNATRTPSRTPALSALDRIRQAARRDGRQRFTALLHHVYDVERLRQAYYALKRTAAAGVDGQTWKQYGEELEGNLRDLSDRLRRGGYRAKPVRRTYIPKADGRQRPLGVPALEDKLVQRAVVEVLNAIYEQDFLGFSYGFRPKRNPHQALDALAVAIHTRKVNWVLDADIRAFFDTLDHGWLVKFVEHRIGDRRIVRLIQKWLRAGVLEEGERVCSEEGTVQGGNISPLLANIFLHYVFDLWTQRWRTKQARGDVVAVRYGDDFVVGFEHREEAERFLTELRERFQQFGLELHPDKTRLLPFGRQADRRWRNDRGDKPGTFNFLGFTHSCGKTRKGGFTVLRQTMRKRVQAKLKEVKDKLRRRMHDPIPEQGAFLGAVVRGHVRYYGVPMNGWAITAFRRAVGRLWCRTLRRRSQKHRLRWERMHRLIRLCLPPARVCHPYPLQRFGVRTQGRSPVR